MKYLLVMAIGIKQSSLHLKVCVCFVVFMVLNYIAWVKSGERKKIAPMIYLYIRGGGGDSHMKGTGMIVGNFELNP